MRDFPTKLQRFSSDLELAASLIQVDIAAHNYDIRERTITSGSNNTPTVSWQMKGSTTTTLAPAYLLRLQAMHQCYHRYQSSPFFVPGRLNSMADDCSRLWNLTNSALLAHLNRQYPQTTSWQIVHPRSEMLTSVISARAGIVFSRAASNDAAWLIWERFCNKLTVDPWLTDNIDPIPLLQVFAKRYRTGDIAPRQRPVKSSTVEGALCAVGQTFAGLGAQDPRLTPTGKTKFRLSRQLRGHAKADDLPTRPGKTYPGPSHSPCGQPGATTWHCGVGGGHEHDMHCLFFPLLPGRVHCYERRQQPVSALGCHVLRRYLPNTSSQYLDQRPCPSHLCLSDLHEPEQKCTRQSNWSRSQRRPLHLPHPCHSKTSQALTRTKRDDS
jgi:hypothetical protein